MSTKHAVLIGINKYPHYEQKMQLRGCVNDAKLMKSILIDRFNFDESNICDLHDEAATRENILGEMQRLEREVAENDIVVFHYSGHGRRRMAKLRRNTEIRPTDGDWFDQSEGSGYDSTLMPSDTGPAPIPHLDITDNTIHDWLERLTQKTRYVTLVIDACHSGTITREAFAATNRTGPFDDREPLEMVAGDEERPRRKKGKSGWLAESENYVAISGCEDHEVSKEASFGDAGTMGRHGALTFNLVKALMDVKPGTTYRDIYEIASTNVTARFKTQHPQIQGALDREVFGVSDIEPLRSIPLKNIDGDKVILAGGAAHGLRVGSIWEVYPRGTKKIQDASSQGLIKIEEVGALTSRGVIREAFADITAGSRCTEKISAASKNKLAVNLSGIPDTAGDELSMRIKQSPLLCIADDESDADIKAYVITPRQQAVEGDPIPGISAVAAQSWALVDLDGDLAMPLHGVDEAGVIDKLIHNLETAARYQNLLQLENPSSQLDVEFNIHHRTSSFELLPANGGTYEIQEGDCVAFELVNRGVSPAWFSVLYFDVDGTMFPCPTMEAPGIKVVGGRSVIVGKDEIDIAPNLGELAVDRGTPTFKAFITNRPANFEWQQQSGFRSSGSKMASQIEAADTGVDPKVMTDDQEDWKSISRSIIVKRNK